MSKIYRERIVVIFTGLLSLLMVVIIVGSGLFFIKPAQKGGTDQVIIVREGMSLKEVAGRLESHGLISNKTIFMLWTRVMGYSRQIKAGEYRLNLTPSLLKTELEGFCALKGYLPLDASQGAMM